MRLVFGEGSRRSEAPAKGTICRGNQEGTFRVKGHAVLVDCGFFQGWSLGWKMQTLPSWPWTCNLNMAPFEADLGSQITCSDSPRGSFSVKYGDWDLEESILGKMPTVQAFRIEFDLQDPFLKNKIWACWFLLLTLVLGLWG